VDFIFGRGASLWITKSVIRTIGKGFITASGRSTDDASWYVINQSNVTGSGQLYLGRPWRPYARVVFQHCAIGGNVVKEGWSIWTPDDPRTSDILFGEYLNTGYVTPASKDIGIPSTDIERIGTCFPLVLVHGARTEPGSPRILHPRSPSSRSIKSPPMSVYQLGADYTHYQHRARQ
jgi:hypothetical protein